ncbi:MAG: PIN domain-containing protein [Rhodoglobus sp.]
MTPRAVIIDTSVWSRLSSTAAVRGAMQELIATTDPSLIWMCPPVAAELGFSARNGVDHTALMVSLEAFPDCALHPSAHEVLDIQNALWTAGFVRSVGAMDAQIAAYARKNDAVIVHLDRDFEHVASVIPGFTQRWLVPSSQL